MKKGYWSAVATMVGTTVGAGILGIPYVVSKAGFFTGVLDIIFLCALVIVISLYLAEVVLRTKGNHQVTGLAEKYLGKTGKVIMFLTMFFTVVGALVAYSYGSGDAITSIVGGSSFFNSVVFFLLLSLVFYFGIRTFEKFESGATIGIIAIIAFVCVSSLMAFNSKNLMSFDLTKVFIPYGVILFASTGLLVIPELKKELKDKKFYKRTVILGVTIPALLYILFSAAVIGVNGLDTTQVATVGFGAALGSLVHFVGNIFAVFVMATSFVAMGFALKTSYVEDYNLKNMQSWVFVIIVPLTIILLEIGDFIKIIEYTSILGTSTMLACIMIMHSRAKKLGNRKPEFSIPGPIWLKVIFLLLFIMGAINLFL